MSELKFTPGPLIATGAGGKVYVAEQRNDLLFEVADCGDGANERSWPFAKLFAAAPELLERLIELMEYSDALKGSAVHQRCLDAIAKATA